MTLAASIKDAHETVQNTEKNLDFIGFPVVASIKAAQHKKKSRARRWATFICFVFCVFYFLLLIFLLSDVNFWEATLNSKMVFYSDQKIIFAIFSKNMLKGVEKLIEMLYNYIII